MNHIVYKTTNLINGKIYIGKHSTENLNDGYLGSGVLITRAIKKYSKENFERLILKSFNSSKEAYVFESKIVNSEFIDREDTYNIIPGGIGSTKCSKYRNIKIKVVDYKTHKLIGNYHGIYKLLEALPNLTIGGVTTFLRGIGLSYKGLQFIVLPSDDHNFIVGQHNYKYKKYNIKNDTNIRVWDKKGKLKSKFDNINEMVRFYPEISVNSLIIHLSKKHTFMNFQKYIITTGDEPDYILTGNSKYKNTTIFMYTKGGKYVKSYNGIYRLMIDNDFVMQNVLNCISNSDKSHKGFRFILSKI